MYVRVRRTVEQGGEMLQTAKFIRREMPYHFGQGLVEIMNKKRKEGSLERSHPMVQSVLRRIDSVNNVYNEYADEVCGFYQ